MLIQIFKKLFIFQVLLLHGCQGDLTETTILQGMVGSKAFTYKYGKANQNWLIDGYIAELYGQDQEDEDPCLIYASSSSYISLEIPSTIGFYQIPSDLAITFQQPGIADESYQATSGFLEVIDMNLGRMNVYLEANYNTENTVRGTFIIDLCY